ncbi:MAG: FRG domain-containing protein [Erysipelotrichaceae bacterium]|nr:FRG domain-containing protein [Erysipelotrichaceae bacterium]
METLIKQLTRARKFLTDDDDYSIIYSITDKQLIKRYFLNYKKIIIDDCINAMRSYAEYKSSYKPKDSEYPNTDYYYKIVLEIEINDSSEDDIKNMIFLHSLFRIKRMSKSKEIVINSYDDVIRIFENQTPQKWYRGHSDSSWQLLPSFFRDIQEKQIEFNYNLLVDDYKKKKILEKMNTIMNANKIDYRFFSYVQHSLGYGPFLDFSKSPQVAFSFTLSNRENVSLFFHKPSCLYELDTTNLPIIHSRSDINRRLKKLNISVFKSKASIEQIIKSSMWENLLNNTLESEIFLCDYQSNDRMRYQKGAFVLFNNVLIIGNRMLMSFKKQDILNQSLTKYIFPEDIHLTLYHSFLDKYPQYHIRFLMDPYSYMRE